VLPGAIIAGPGVTTELQMQKLVLVAGAVALTAFAASTFTEGALGASKSTKHRSAASIECSHQADAKGLHG
jgi:hypothetical protein